MAEPEFLSLSQAAKKQGVTRQSVYLSIKKNRLKAVKKGDGRWIIKADDVKAYEKTKYSREHSMHNGEPVFDTEKGIYNVAETAKILRMPKQHVYYILRNNYLKSSRKGSAWVINQDDIDKYTVNRKERRERIIKEKR